MSFSLVCAWSPSIIVLPFPSTLSLLSGVGLLDQIIFNAHSQGSAYSPLPLRTHTQDPQAREMEEASDHHPVSLNTSHQFHNNHGSSNLHHAAVASIPNLNTHGGLQSSHYQNSHGGPAGSSHPIPSTKKKPAPLPPVRTPPTPPKKAPLRLPAENTWMRWLGVNERVSL